MHRRKNGTKSLEKWVKTLKELTSRKKDIDLADDQDHLLIGGELVPGDGGRGAGAGAEASDTRNEYFAIKQSDYIFSSISAQNLIFS